MKLGGPRVASFRWQWGDDSSFSPLAGDFANDEDADNYGVTMIWIADGNDDVGNIENEQDEAWMWGDPFSVQGTPPLL